METSSIDFRSIQRWCVVSVLVLVESVIWIGSKDSGIAKLPVLVLGALLIAALFLFECTYKRRLSFSLSIVDVVVFLHLPLFVSSAVFHYDPVYTPSALSLAIACLVFYFAAASSSSDEGHVDTLLRWFEWLTLLLCLVAVMQFFFADFIPLQFDLGPHRRVSSLLGNSGYFSSYLVVVVPLILGRIFAADPHSVPSRFRWGLLGLMFFSLVATQTRSSILGSGASVALFVSLSPMPRKAKLVVLFFVTVIFGAVLSQYLLGPEYTLHSIAPMADSRSSTLDRRLFFWSAGRDAFLASPVYGHGIGSFEKVITEYRAPDYWIVGSEDVVPHAHNEIIEIAAEYGTIGVGIFLVTFSLILWRGFRLTRSGTTWQNWTSASIVSALVGIGIDNLASVSLRQAPIAALVWTLMGVLNSQALTVKRDWNFSISWRMPRIVAALPLVLCLAAAVWYGGHEVSRIDSSVHMQRAMDSAQKGSVGTVEEYREAVAEDPFNLLARSQLSLTLLKIGQFQAALQEVDSLQTLSPSYPQSHLMKGYAELQLGQIPNALKSIDAELRERAHPEAFQIRAAILRRLGQPADERDALIHALRLDIAARHEYGYRESLTRLWELNKTADETKECLAIMDSMETIFTRDHSFFESLRHKIDTGGVSPSVR